MSTPRPLAPNSESNTQAFVIPKIIHFIWAGGLRLMPSKSQAIVLEWASTNPDFEVWIWVDSKTYEKSGNLEEQYKVLSEKYNLNFRNTSIKIKDIEIENIANPTIRYLIDCVRPNYGASSDLIRYQVLYNNGGAYFDSDIKPAAGSKAQNLGDFLKSLVPNQHHLIMLDHITQIPNTNATSEALNNFDISLNSRVGNDSFICTKTHPIMKRILDEAINNYTKGIRSLISKIALFGNPNLYPLVPIIKMAYGTSDRRTAIFMTGPQNVRYAINQYDLVKIGQYYAAYEKSSERKTAAEESSVDNTAMSVKNTVLPVESESSQQMVSIIKPLRNREYRLTDPLPNTLNWLQVIFNDNIDGNNIENLIETITKEIIFEAKHLKIIRLEEHIEDLKIILAKELVDNYDRELLKASEILLKNMTENIMNKMINLEDIQCVQYPFIYENIYSLYNKYQLMENTKIEKGFPLILNEIIGKSLIDEVIGFYNNKQMKSAVVGKILSDQINKTICFIRHFLEPKFNATMAEKISGSTDFLSATTDSILFLKSVITPFMEGLDHESHVFNQLNTDVKALDLLNGAIQEYNSLKGEGKNANAASISNKM